MYQLVELVCLSDATLDLECSKGLLGQKSDFCYKMGYLNWEAGDATLWMLCLYFIAVLCLSVEVLRGYSTKPMLSAKRLLGLHNHGTISFSFSFLCGVFFFFVLFLKNSFLSPLF